VTLGKLDLPDPDSLLHIVAMREGRESPLRYALFERLGENLAFVDSLCYGVGGYSIQSERREQ